MLPVLPKVTKLQRKKISSFGGIDRREGAKENTFSKLCGVDNANGMSLETGNRFKKVIVPFEIHSDDIACADNDSGGVDVFYLGEGGFYKNGELLPFKITEAKIDLTWLEEHTKNLSLGTEGEAQWCGEYQNTKLIRYDNCIFAVPQMIYTDGENTFLWDKLTSGKTNGTEVSTSQGVITIKSTRGWRESVFGQFKAGENLEVFINERKLSGQFILKTNKDDYVEIQGTKSDGKNYSFSDLGVGLTSSFTVSARVKGVPEFTDAGIIYNRMWGVSGNRVYASHIAQPSNFYEGDGTESDAWWADTEDKDGFTAMASLGGRIIAFKRNSTYEIYGTVNPYTIKDTSRSMGCISVNSLREVNGVLFMMTGEGINVYGGSKFVDINESLCTKATKIYGVGKGSKYYALMNDGVYKYDYYSGLWTNVTDMKLTGLVDVDFDVFGLTDKGYLVQLTGEKKPFFEYGEDVEREWMVESTAIGSGDFYAEGINKLELRFETEGKGKMSVEVCRDSGGFEHCGEIETGEGWQIFSLPISFVPCSTFRYRIKGLGKARLRLISYSFRKGGGANRYE